MRIVRDLLLLAGLFSLTPIAAAAQPAPLEIAAGDRVVFIGNTFAERMQLFPHLEAILTADRPEREITFRYLAWSGDELNLRPRPLNFGDLHTHLEEQRADVIFAAFGMNESFRGEAHLPQFRTELAAFVDSLQSRHYNGTTPPQIVLISPIPHEDVARVPLDPSGHNADLGRYTAAMQTVAEEKGVRFIDLFQPLRPLMEDPALGDLTINGIHLDDRGYLIASRLMAQSLGWLSGEADLLAPADAQHLRLAAAIHDKNEIFFLRWRAVNGEYIYGRRKEPFGVVNFPAEMEQLEQMIAAAEREIWSLALETTTAAR